MMYEDPDMTGLKPPPLSHQQVEHLPLPPSNTAPDIHSIVDDSLPPPRLAWLTCGVVCSALFAIVCFLLAALVTQIVQEEVIKHLHEDGLLASTSSPIYPSWSNNTDNPLKLTVYLFNVSNAEDIINGAAPVLQEVGPFVFIDTRVKLNVSWSSDGTILSYNEWATLTLDPVASAYPDLSATLLQPNILFYFRYALASALGWEDFVELFKDAYYNGTMGPTSVLFTARTVQDILFDEQLGFFKDSNQTAEEALKVPGDVIYTGVNDTDLSRQYVLWHQQSIAKVCMAIPVYEEPGPYLCSLGYGDVVPVWADDASSFVHGSDGGQFPASTALDSDSQPLFYFYPFQRAIQMEYHGHIEYNGVSALRYHFPSSLYSNSTINPVNAAYYQYIYNGALNMSSLTANTPSFVTTPDFGSLDRTASYYPELDITRSPFPYPQTDPDAFDTYLDVEPVSGLTVHTHSSSQANFYIQPLQVQINATTDTWVTWFPNVTPTFLPLMYAIEDGGIDDTAAANFKTVELITTVLRVTPYVFYPLASVLLICCLVLLYMIYQRRRRWRLRQSLAGRGGPTEKTPLSAAEHSSNSHNNIYSTVTMNSEDDPPHPYTNGNGNSTSSIWGRITHPRSTRSEKSYRQSYEYKQDIY